jgi:26S proteasome regulatory subunit T6
MQVDPLVSLMMVEKVPDSTYDMVGGLDKQIKEIKEVRGGPVLWLATPPSLPCST